VKPLRSSFPKEKKKFEKSLGEEKKGKSLIELVAIL